MRGDLISEPYDYGVESFESQNEDAPHRSQISLYSFACGASIWICADALDVLMGAANLVEPEP